MSFDIVAREENIELNNMHAGIQLLLNEQPFQPPPLEQRNCGPLEQCNFGDLGYNSRLPEDLHTSMTGMFERHLQTLDNPFPNSHNGSMSWGTRIRRNEEDFRSRHADLPIPTGTGDQYHSAYSGTLYGHPCKGTGYTRIFTPSTLRPTQSNLRK